MFEFEIQRCARRCSATDRELAPGELVYSVLVREGPELVRRDYCHQAWQGPPEEAVGWWRSQIPVSETKKLGWAPNEIMLELFEQLETQADQQDLRYVLGLLLVRRRIMRLDNIEDQPDGTQHLVLQCAKNETQYHVPVVTPSEQRVQEIQDKLAQLLFK